MDGKNGLEPGVREATAAPARAQNAGDAVAGRPLRFSAKRKLAVVQRLLRRESLEKVSRETNVPVHRLSEWRDRALPAAESALKERDQTPGTRRSSGSKPRWAASPWPTSCSTQRSTCWRAAPFGRKEVEEMTRTTRPPPRASTDCCALPRLEVPAGDAVPASVCRC